MGCHSSGFVLFWIGICIEELVVICTFGSVYGHSHHHVADTEYLMRGFVINHGKNVGMEGHQDQNVRAEDHEGHDPQDSSEDETSCIDGNSKDVDDAKFYARKAHEKVREAKTLMHGLPLHPYHRRHHLRSDPKELAADIKMLRSRAKRMHKALRKVNNYLKIAGMETVQMPPGTDSNETDSASGLLDNSIEAKGEDKASHTEVSIELGNIGENR